MLGMTVEGGHLLRVVSLWDLIQVSGLKQLPYLLHRKTSA